MKRLSTAVDDIRLDRKRFSISGSLLPFLLLLVLLVTQTSARSVIENEKTATAGEKTLTQISSERAQHQQQPKNEALYNDDLAFDGADEYADIDNVEWHHVKIVDGIMHEDHPIIMYKEDFVSEDYDPNKHNSNSEQANHQRRKYKNIKRQKRLNHTDEQTETIISSTSEKYHALKPEKIYFDILPPTPVVLSDDSSSNDSKFDPSRIRVEVISLLDEEKKSATMPEDDETTKQLLNKRPKKYHHHNHQRKRRDLSEVQAKTNDEQNVHIIKKRNPHYLYTQPSNSFDVYNKHWNNWQQKHPVAGNRWNGIDGDVPKPPPLDPFIDNRFGGESNTDRVVWGKATRKVKTTTRPTQRPTVESIFHNSNPEDADFSIFNKNDNRRPQTNNRIPNNNNNNNRRPANQNPNVFNRPALHSPQPLRNRFSQENLENLRFSVNYKSNARNIEVKPDDDDDDDNVENYYYNNKDENDAPFDADTVPTSLKSEETVFGFTSNQDEVDCKKATATCCAQTELYMLYDCFHAMKCARSIAQIMSLCT